MPREIVTLQFGNYANHVGAHYWNLQDEVLGYSDKEEWREYTSTVDTDVLYHAGEDKQDLGARDDACGSNCNLFELIMRDPQGNATYQPRVLMVDLCGALGGVRISSDPAWDRQQSAQPIISTWGAGVEVHQAPQLPRSAFVNVLEQQAAAWGHENEDEQAAAAAALEAAARNLEVEAEGGARFWTDYLKAALSPSSIYTVPGMWHGVVEFAGFGEGAALMTPSSDTREVLCDKVRQLGEACDSLQGFQVFVDDQGGFGGVAAQVLEEIHQDYGGGRPVFVFSLRRTHPLLTPQSTPGMRTRAAINEALSLQRLVDLSSLYIPTAPPTSQDLDLLPNLRFSRSSTFHTSALLAAAIDTATLPARLAAGASTPIGLPSGDLSLLSIAACIKGRGSPGMAALQLLMPAAALETDLHQAAASEDVRVKHPHARHAAPPSTGTSKACSAASSSASANQPLPEALDVWKMASLTPCIKPVPTDNLAEIITLRGARCTTGPATCSTTLSALDASLIKGPRRTCVVHRCVAPLPLLVPLPFPSIWGPRVGQFGDVEPPGWNDVQQAGALPAAAAGQQASGNQGGKGGGNTKQSQDVLSVPVATKLLASPAFRGHIDQVIKQWRTACVSAGGRVLLENWDYQGGDLSDVTEGLMALSASYAHDEEEGEEL